MRSATRAEVTESFFRDWWPTKMTRPGLEPGTSGSGSRPLIHYSVALFQFGATTKAKASKSSSCRIVDLRPHSHPAHPAASPQIRKARYLFLLRRFPWF
jgi:hypothetical protein